MSAFEEVGLLPELIRSIEDMGWILPTPIQAECIPLILGGGDVLGAAETGSGKTGAFALPLLQVCVEEYQRRAQKKSLPMLVKQGDVAVEHNCVVWNASDRDEAMSISNDGMVCTSKVDKFIGCRGSVGVNLAAKLEFCYYFECTVIDGLCRVGWATSESLFEIGTDKFSFGYGGTGMKSFSKKFEKYGESFGKNDVIGCLLNPIANTISYSKNGISLGDAYQLPSHLKSATLYPAISIKNGVVSAQFNSTPKFSVTHQCISMEEAFSKSVGIVSKSSQSMELDEAINNNKNKGPIGLIIEPTRELAIQVYDEIEKFKTLLEPSITHSLFIGGDSDKRFDKCSTNADIVVATCGSLLRLIQSKKISLSSISMLVLDEADRLLDDGNKKSILDICSLLPSQRQLCLFSATLHSESIKSLAAILCPNAMWIDLKGKDATPESVDHALIYITNDISTSLNSLSTPSHDCVHGTNLNEKEQHSLAIKLLKPKALIKILDTFEMEQCLIFCRTKVDCDNLEQYLQAVGGGSKFRGAFEKGKEGTYSCVVLHSDRSQQERSRNLEAFKNGYIRLLICTDVAARGIDISGLPFVINMSLPAVPEDYIHRVGRVGRADCNGFAVSLVAMQPEKVWYHTCPSKGKSCQNTDKCCIWQNEMELKNEIEKRLKNQISVLDPNNMKAGRESVIAQAGINRKDEFNIIASKHLEILKPACAALNEMETQAQLLYFNYSKQFK